MDTGITWADMRWREAGWQEVFRLRISGWLPAEWVSEGVRLGVLAEREEYSRIFDITVRGRELTDIVDVVASEDIAMQIGNTLAVRGWQRSWFEPNLEVKGGWSNVADIFPLQFRESLVAAFDRSSEQMEQEGTA